MAGHPDNHRAWTARPLSTCHHASCPCCGLQWDGSHINVTKRSAAEAMWYICKSHLTSCAGRSWDFAAGYDRTSANASDFGGIGGQNSSTAGGSASWHRLLQMWPHSSCVPQGRVHGGQGPKWHLRRSVAILYATIPEGKIVLACQGCKDRQTCDAAAALHGDRSLAQDKADRRREQWRGAHSRMEAGSS